jgi:beta-N-acetylhexosaminidase
LEQKIGQMIMIGVSSTQIDPSLAALMRDQHVGAVAFVGNSFTDPVSVRDFTSRLQAMAVGANGTAMLIAADEEGGCVRRLGGSFSPLPSAKVMGATGRPDLVRQAVAAVGQEMDAVGVNQDLAPVLGLEVPGNPIIAAYERSFGPTPAIIFEMGEAFIEGLHDADVIATIKHFPGHGSTTQDSHLVLPVVTKSAQELRAQDMAPFIEAIQAGGVDVVMTANVLYTGLDPNRPASLSAPIVTGVLRYELGFGGVIMTDDLTMKAITDSYSVPEAAELAVEAGVDMFIVEDATLAPAVLQQLVAAVQAGRISEQRIDESFGRLQALKERYGLPRPGAGDLSLVGSPAHLSLMTAVRQAAGISSICP